MGAVLQVVTQVQPGCASFTWQARLQLGKQPQLTSSSCGPATQAALLQQRRRSLAACSTGLLRLACCLHGQWASSAACAACACCWFRQLRSWPSAEAALRTLEKATVSPSCPDASRCCRTGPGRSLWDLRASVPGLRASIRPKDRGDTQHGQATDGRCSSNCDSGTGRGRGPFVTGREGCSNVSRPELTHDRERDAAINLAHRPGPQNYVGAPPRPRHTAR